MEFMGHGLTHENMYWNNISLNEIICFGVKVVWFWFIFLSNT
jgi:hypothetical protein